MHKEKVLHKNLLVLACPNSDGLSNFMWSHNGYWGLGGTLVGKNYTVAECAEACIAHDKCIAFSYNSQQGKMKNHCYHYYDKNYLNDENMNTRAHIKAYIRCQGTES